MLVLALVLVLVLVLVLLVLLVPLALPNVPPPPRRWTSCLLWPQGLLAAARSPVEIVLLDVEAWDSSECRRTAA